MKRQWAERGAGQSAGEGQRRRVTRKPSTKSKQPVNKQAKAWGPQLSRDAFRTAHGHGHSPQVAAKATGTMSVSPDRRVDERAQCPRGGVKCSSAWRERWTPPGQEAGTGLGTCQATQRVRRTRRDVQVRGPSESNSQEGSRRRTRSRWEGRTCGGKRNKPRRNTACRDHSHQPTVAWMRPGASQPSCLPHTE